MQRYIDPINNFLKDYSSDLGKQTLVEMYTEENGCISFFLQDAIYVNAYRTNLVKSKLGMQLINRNTSTVVNSMAVEKTVTTLIVPRDFSPMKPDISIVQILVFGSTLVGLAMVYVMRQSNQEMYEL